MTEFTPNRTATRRLLAIALCSGSLLAGAAADTSNAGPDPAAAAHDQERSHHGPREIDLAVLRERARSAFDRIDSNDDERINEAELAAAGPMSFAPGTRGHRRHGGSRHHGRWHGPRGGDGGRSDAAPGVRPSDAPEALGALFARLDADRDGKLSNTEFAKLPEARRAQRSAQVFARFDRDSNGALDRNEFPPRLARLEALDTNRDGKVTRDEMRAGHQQHRNADPQHAEPSGQRG